MKKLKIGEILNVQAYKHDGTLYRQWNGVRVIEVSPFHVALLMFKTKVKEVNGQTWVVREPTLWFFQEDEFYNTTGLLRTSGVHYYTNLASPPVIEEGTIKYIDYDLDIKAYPKQNVKVVDRNDFAKNQVKYSYSKKLVEKIEQTTEYVLDLINTSQGYFDRGVINSYVDDLIESQQLTRKYIISKPKK